jgi:hypothetical protein
MKYSTLKSVILWNGEDKKQKDGDLQIGGGRARKIPRLLALARHRRNDGKFANPGSEVQVSEVARLSPKNGEGRVALQFLI